MTIRCLSFALALMLLLVVAGAQVTALCSDAKIPSGSPYFDTLGRLFVDLEQNTGSSNGYSYKTSSVGAGGSPTAYGKAYCNEQYVTGGDCTNCLTSICNQSWGLCGNSIGAYVQSGADCYIQYEQYYF